MRIARTILLYASIGMHFSVSTMHRFARFAATLKRVVGTKLLPRSASVGALVYVRSHTDYDSEAVKMAIAERSAQKRINGFQGCVNQKVCGFDGFYLAHYSPEGLCDSCEFERYSERFVACIFCRVPHKKFSEDTQSACYSGCESFIQKLLVENTKVEDEWYHTHKLEMGAHILVSKLSNSVSRNYIPAFGNKKTKFDFGCKVRAQRKTLEDRPGLYLGAVQLSNGNKLHVWTDKLPVDPVDKRLVTDWDDAAKHLEFICKKYNMFGPETGEITLKEVPEGAFTYEEILPR